MENDTIRERFEIWWQTVSKGKSTPPRYKEGYLHDNPNLAWVAWQAASTRNDAPQTSREDELVGYLRQLHSLITGSDDKVSSIIPFKLIEDIGNEIQRSK